MQIFAWDPGLTTGLCFIEGDDWLQEQATFRQVGDILTEWDTTKTVESNAVFVVESFTINNQTAKNSQAPWSLEVIGLLRYFAMAHHLEIIFQQPSAVKRLITDDVIKRAGKWKKGLPHSMDATRHLLHYLVTKKGEMRECLLPPSTLMSQEIE